MASHGGVDLMALYGVAFTLTYVAWDTSANEGKTGDVANHTLRWVQDGTSGAPSNSPAEVDATNVPGLYKLALTAAEAQAVYGSLAGKSTTANVSIMPVSIAFERLPNAAPGANGGLPTVDANNYVAGIQGTLNQLDDLENLSAAEVATELATYDGPTYTELLNLFRVALRKDSAIATDLAAVLTAINADLASGGGAYANTQEALEALRDRGDAAWLTATGFSSHTAADVRTELDANSTQLAAIVADTNELETDWSDGGRLDLILDARASQASVDAVSSLVTALNDLDAAAVQTAVNAALVALHLDHLLAVDYDPAAKPGTATALLNELIESDAGVSRYTANALEQGPSGSVVIDWDELLDFADGVETGYTLREAMRLILASQAGKLSGAATTTVVIRDINDATDRISATVDAAGNRSSVTVDVT